MLRWHRYRSVFSFHQCPVSYTHLSIGKASDNNRFLGGAVLEARIWSVCRTEAQLKANAWDFVEENPDGLLGRWAFSAGAPVAYMEDGTDSVSYTHLVECAGS